MILYNTLSRTEEKFTPLKKKTVGLYSCGPTVYNYAHIGNLRQYVAVDVLKRILAYNGYSVKHVMNITDVGHLVDEVQDLGEDRLEKGAKRENKTVWQVATFYTNAFKKDIARLNISPPNKWTRATDHIQDQIRLIKILEKKGFTYEGTRAVYFDTSKVRDYGKLAKLHLKAQQVGAGVRSGEKVVVDTGKKNKNDFVLWFKRVGKYKNHAMHWKSPWGDGFPGWHIECSAMSMKYLGSTLDIHYGGIDHVTVHHPNEIAQSEAATGKPLAKYWLHGEHLIMGGAKKMAKSGKSFITLEDLVKKRFDPLSLRYLYLMSHYRSQIEFSWESLAAAQNGLSHMNARMARILRSQKVFIEVEARREVALVRRYRSEFGQAISDDLNTSEALALTWTLLKDAHVSGPEKRKLVAEVDTIFGLDLMKQKKISIPVAIRALVKEREVFRAEKNFKKADVIRARVARKGFAIEDTPQGSVVFPHK